MKRNSIIKTLIIVFLLCNMFAFNKVNSYAESNFTSETFNDVPTNSWFYSGVKTSFESGLMKGVEKGSFAPNKQFTLAEAITIAARMYANDKNEKINTDAAKIWYQPYIDYAKDNNLISESMINMENLNQKKATRAETAYLFNNVVSVKEKTAKYINNAVIPDLNSIPIEYQNAVSELYKKGIITGMPNGLIDGNSSITRAQISVIINRIYNDIERIPYDPKYNNEMAGQAGNLFMYNGTVVYDVIYTYFSVSNGYGKGENNIIRKNNSNGHSEALYIGNGDIYNLRLKDGKLYFIENLKGNFDSNWGDKVLVTKKAYIICLNLESKKANCIYMSDDFSKIHAFELYDNDIYVNLRNDNSIYNSKIIKISVDKQTDIVKYNHEYAEGRTIFLYNDTLYYTSGGFDYKTLTSKVSLNAFDLKNNTNDVIIKNDISDYVMSNGILYLIGLSDSGDNSGIWKLNLSTGDSYLDDRKSIFLFNGKGFGVGDVAFSFIEGNLYLGEQNSSSILKVLSDGTVRVLRKTMQPPRNFIITPGDHYFYSMYWQPTRGQYGEVDNFDYFNGIKDFVSVPQNGYISATLSIADGKTDVFNGDLTTITSDFKHITFTWHDPLNANMEYKFSLNQALYKKYKDVDRNSHLLSDGRFYWHDYSHYVNNPDDDYFLNLIAREFLSMSEKYGHTDPQILQSIANFVQEIPYVSDKIGTGYDEYPKYPIETLYDSSGDCEDSSILLASLYLEMGFDTVMIEFPEHMMVAVACSDIKSGDYVLYNDKQYFFIETTSYGWKLGELPTELEGMDIAIHDIN